MIEIALILALLAFTLCVRRLFWLLHKLNSTIDRQSDLLVRLTELTLDGKPALRQAQIRTKWKNDV